MIPLIILNLFVPKIAYDPGRKVGCFCKGFVGKTLASAVSVYKSVTGICWKADGVFQTILVGDTLIQFDCIRTVDGQVFEEGEE